MLEERKVIKSYFIDVQTPVIDADRCVTTLHTRQRGVLMAHIASGSALTRQLFKERTQLLSSPRLVYAVRCVLQCQTLALRPAFGSHWSTTRHART